MVVIAAAPNHFDPLQIAGYRSPGQIPSPLLGLQTQGNPLPGIWMCKDKNGDTVFSNRPRHYRGCQPYVASPGLRDAFREEMLLNRKQQIPQHPIPNLSSSKSEVIGPL